MSEPISPKTAGPLPENQQQRWAKYGANVVLSTVIVIILGAIVVWGAQKFVRRSDLTVNSAYSLKPQTVNLIQGLKTPVRLVSIYPKLKREEVGTQQDFYQPVADLLHEYQRKGANIDVEVIDPVSEPAKLDAWVGEVTRKYGGNVKGYRDVLVDFPKTLQEIQTLASAESKRMETLQNVQVKDENQAEIVNVAYSTVQQFPSFLKAIGDQIKEELDKKLPDYKGQVDNVKSTLGIFSRRVGGVQKALEKLRDDKTAPKEITDYATGSIDHFAQMKKLADAQLDKIGKLGELKLDEVRRKLTTSDDGGASAPAIAVEGPSDIKLIDFKDVWKSGESTGLTPRRSGPARLRFAGEQQITSAILSLTESKRTKIAFIRAGGPPKLSPGFTGWNQSLSDMAGRLRSYNFEVVEKDVTGQFAQMAQMQQMPVPPDPSDEEVKDAVWVIFAEPPQQQQSQFGEMPPSPVLGQKLKDHLEQGGSALCLFSPRGDDLSAALHGWGLEVKTSVVAVHEPMDSGPEDSADFVEQARRQPPIFVINEYGHSPITDSLVSLDSAIVPMLPVQAPGAPDCTVTRILPVPEQPKSWGESDLSSISSRDTAPTFDAATGDLPAPIYSGALAEKKGKGRLVAIGCADFISNVMLNLPDPKLARAKVDVARFPGNGELFTNSIFWLAKQDQMIGLSPAALDTARIVPMSSGVLAFWRVGVLLIGLPLLATICGLVVHQARRD